MNALTKFFILIIYCILLFLFRNIFVIGFLCFLSLLLFCMSLGFSEIIKKKMILFFAFFILVVNLMFLDLSLAERMIFSLRMVFRFLGIIFSGMLFSGSDPNEFAYSLMRLGVAYRYAFTFVLTFRLVPLFDFESNIIRKAQIARGVNLKGVQSIPNSVRYTFFPLLHSALERVDSFTFSMEGRCFGLYRKRTFYREASFHKEDYLLTAAGLIVLFFSLWWRYL
ncbi:MAG: energy-coupling factor transporter transmembrane component T [Euryarchaeota archaeon]|nr:energy-coupling factor transporter transmembrane component T [Euryarchaeota archaeon]